MRTKQLTKSFEPRQKQRPRFGSSKTCLSAPVIFAERSKGVLLLWFLDVTLCYVRLSMFFCGLVTCFATQSAFSFVLFCKLKIK